MSDSTITDQAALELSECSAWARRDLMDDIITADNFHAGDPMLLDWLTSLGLEPLNIPFRELIIDPKVMRLYWREFWLDADGNRQSAGGNIFRRTRTKSMPLAELPSFLI